jgi:hypothetical protein
MKYLRTEMRDIKYCLKNKLINIKLDKEQYIYIIKRKNHELVDDVETVVNSMKSHNIIVISVEYKEDLCLIKYEITDEEIISDTVNYDWQKTYK